MLAVTTFEIPGWEIRRVYGEVFGLTVRSRNAFSQFGAGLKSIVGGELKGMTTNLINSRNEVMGRMLEEAQKRGGERRRRDALRHLRDGRHRGPRLCAYGTAVQAVPVTEEAKEVARQMGYQV